MTVSPIPVVAMTRFWARAKIRRPAIDSWYSRLTAICDEILLKLKDYEESPIELRGGYTEIDYT
jgi:hypothetical protein